MIIQNHKRNIKKYIYKENPESKKEYQRKKKQGKKKVFNKAEKFHQQIRQGPYYICTVCHHCLYQHSARLFHDQKYVLNWELHHPVTSFNSKIYFYEKCYDHLLKSVIPCEVGCNKMKIHRKTDQWIFYKNLKCLEEILISKWILFKKSDNAWERGIFKN